MFANQESEGDVFRNMILPVCGCEIRCNALAEKYRLRMFENRARRKIFRPRGEEIYRRVETVKGPSGRPSRGSGD